MDARDLDIARRRQWSTRIEREDFLELYARYYDRIFRFCHGRVLNPELAEDLTAETFMQALTHLDRFRWQGVTFGSWLYRIALNQVRYRRRDAHDHEHLDDHQDAVVDEAADPLDLVLLDDGQRRVRRAIALLDEDTREAIRLQYWDGLTPSEIAVVLDQPVGTVKARLGRGRQKLRSTLEAWEAAGDVPADAPADLPMRRRDDA